MENVPTQTVDVDLSLASMENRYELKRTKTDLDGIDLNEIDSKSQK